VTPSLKTIFCGIEFKNPIITASGTFGFGREYGEFYSLSELGGITVKGLTPLPRSGNPPPRIAETPSGMLNSIGLQNPGVDAFIKLELPFLRQFDVRIIANISAPSAEEFGIMAAKLSGAGVDLIEVNVSCPNVKNEGMQFGSSPISVAEVTSAVKKNSAPPVVVKLSPNVTDIKQIARAAEDAGADGLCLINTLLAMRIDINTRKPVLKNITGGLSGPAVFPIALRCVFEAASSVGIPIIGMGGISSGRDAAEMMLAGASLIGIGTASFSDPFAPIRIRGELSEYMESRGIGSTSEITGGIIIE